MCFTWDWNVQKYIQPQAKYEINVKSLKSVTTGWSSDFLAWPSGVPSLRPTSSVDCNCIFTCSTVWKTFNIACECVHERVCGCVCEPCGMLRIEPRLTTSKASVLPTVLSIRPLQYFKLESNIAPAPEKMKALLGQCEASLVIWGVCSVMSLSLQQRSSCPQVETKWWLALTCKLYSSVGLFSHGLNYTSPVCAGVYHRLLYMLIFFVHIFYLLSVTSLLFSFFVYGFGVWTQDPTCRALLLRFSGAGGQRPDLLVVIVLGLDSAVLGSYSCLWARESLSWCSGDCAVLGIGYWHKTSIYTIYTFKWNLIYYVCIFIAL